MNVFAATFLGCEGRDFSVEAKFRSGYVKFVLHELV